MAVEMRQHRVLSHPVMQELIRQKWKKCVRWSFYALFAMYIAFVLSWSLLIAYPSVQEKHIYVFPRDLWRVILAVSERLCVLFSIRRYLVLYKCSDHQVVAVGTLLYQVGDESLEVLKSKRRHNV